MYESNVIWKEHELRQHQKLDSLGSDRFWFSRIRKNQLQKEMNYKYMLIMGDSLLESTIHLGRRSVPQINRYFWSIGQQSDVEKAATIMTTFGAIGRAGEFSFITYDQAGVELCVKCSTTKCHILLMYQNNG